MGPAAAAGAGGEGGWRYRVCCSSRGRLVSNSARAGCDPLVRPGLDSLSTGGSQRYRADMGLLRITDWNKASRILVEPAVGRRGRSRFDVNAYYDDGEAGNVSSFPALLAAVEFAATIANIATTKQRQQVFLGLVLPDSEHRVDLARLLEPIPDHELLDIVESGEIAEAIIAARAKLAAN